MTTFLSDIILHNENDIQFKTAAGANAGKIEQDGNDLVLSNAVGDILLGDGASDVYIGDGTNNVDILFEQSGNIKADDSASSVTLTLGSSNTTLSLVSPTITGTITDSTNSLAFLAGAQTFTGQKFFDAGFDAHPIMLSGSQNFDNIDRSGFYNLYNASSGSTNPPPNGTYGTMIAIGNDKGGSGFGMQLFHQRTGGAGQLQVRGMNDTGSTWTSWNTVYTASDTAAVANGASTIATGDQIYDFVIGLGYLPKAGGTMSGAIAMGNQNITGAGTITGTTLTGTSLDINGNAAIDGLTTLTHSAHPLTINRTGGATALIELELNGTTEGFIGATSTKSFVVYDETPAEKFSVSNAGAVTAVGSVTATSLDINGNADISGNLTGVDTLTATTFSGDLNGTINSSTTATTQSASNNSTKVATTAYVDAQVATVVDSAPGTLNTLNELAAALGDDASFSTTVTNSIAAKLPLAGGTMSGAIVMGDNDVTGIDELIFTSGTKLGDAGASSYVKLTYAGSSEGGILVYDGDGSRQGYLYGDGGATSSFGLLDGSGSWAVRCLKDSYVELRHDSAVKFQTKSDGVDITGELQCDTLDVDGNADISGTLDVAGDITLGNRFNLGDDGVMTWGNSNNYGQLNWDGDYALISGQSSKGIKFRTNGSGLALTLDTSQNATFAGDVTLTDGSVYITQSIGAETFRVTTAYDRVGKFISTDAGAFLAIQDNTSTDNGVGINVTGDTLKLLTANTQALTLDSSQNATFAGDVTVDKIKGSTYSSNSFLDFDYDETASINNTTLASIARINYIADTNGNDGATVDGHVFYTGTTDIDTATELLSIKNNGNATFAGDIVMANSKILYSDDIRASSGGMIIGPTGESDLVLRTHAQTALTIDGSTRAATFAGEVYIPGKILHSGDTNTYFGFDLGADTYRVVAGGTEKLRTASAGIEVNGELQADTLDIDGNADISGNLTGVDSITASATVQAEHLYSTDDLVVDDDATISGDLTVSGITYGAYHSVVDDQYYFDDYNGSKNLAFFYKNARADIIRYQSVDNFEYWNGSAWVADASQESNVEKLLDGRQDTSWSVPSTYYKFRFTTEATTSWPTMAMIWMQTSWTGSTYPGATMTVEEYDGSSWATKVTAEFTSANGNTNWGLHSRADTALHTGNGSSADTTRITIDFYGWSPSNGSYTTIPLQNLMITSNYAGTENTDYTNLLSHDTHLRLGDSRKFIAGAGDDLQIYHDGSNSYVENKTGDFYIRNKAADKSIVFQADDGSSDGSSIETYFQCEGASGGGAPFTVFPDSSVAAFGSGHDLQIYHDGSNSYIVDAGTGDLLNYFSNDWKVIKYGSSEICIAATSDGAVDLYYDNSKKLETKSDGVDITGELQCDTLDVDGNADISGNLTGVDTLTATTLSVTNYGLASGDIPNNAADTTGNAATATALTSGNKSINGNLTVTGTLTLPSDDHVIEDGANILDENDELLFNFSGGQVSTQGVFDITNTTDSTNATGDTGALRTEGGASIAKKLYVGSTITGSADVIAFSDRKLKDNIETLDGKKVLDMRGVSFTRKDTGAESSGVIAQEIQKVAPELVHDTEGTLGVAYGNLVGYLIEAIKDQQKQIDELKAMCNGCSK